MFSLITEAIPLNLVLNNKLNLNNAIYFCIIIFLNLTLLFYTNKDLISEQAKHFTKVTAIRIIGLFVAIISIQVIFSQLNNHVYHQTISNSSARIGHSLQSGHSIVVIAFFLLVIYTPIVETLLFQSSPQLMFKPNRRIIFSLSTSVIFALLHLPNNPIIFFEYLLSGFILQYFALSQENGISSVIIVHALLNTLSFITFI